MSFVSLERGELAALGRDASAGLERLRGHDCITYVRGASCKRAWPGIPIGGGDTGSPDRPSSHATSSGPQEPSLRGEPLRKVAGSHKGPAAAPGITWHTPRGGASPGPQ